MSQQKKTSEPTTKALKALLQEEPMSQVLRIEKLDPQKDAIHATLSCDAHTPNGFLPEHIRNLLRDAITKTG